MSWRHHHRGVFWKLHLAFILIAVCSVACAAVLSHLVAPAQRVPAPVVPLAEWIDEQAAQGDRQSRVAELSERFHLRISMWDGEGKRIANAGGEMSNPDWVGPSVQWLDFRRGPSAAVLVERGRWVGIGYPFRFDPRRILVGFVVAGAVSALMLLPISRRFSRRIERLDHTVRAWGAGDLSARSSVHGADEVAALARGFNQAADRVQELLDAQRRLLASASHELRSPLARLRMSLELLDDGHPDRVRLIAEASRDIEELDELVGDLLLSSRLQSGPTPTQTQVDLGEIVAAEAARVGAVATGAAQVWGDARMIRRAVRNLVENARRHGGGGIEVEVMPGSPVEIRVHDRGPGVAEVERERIFEPFYRAPGHAEGRDGGVGLGLALVREIARHHGGDVEYAPRQGGGSTFILRLPSTRG